MEGPYFYAVGYIYVYVYINVSTIPPCTLYLDFRGTDVAPYQERNTS